MTAKSIKVPRRKYFSILFGLAVFLVVLAVTRPASLREPSLDDVSHLKDYPSRDMKIPLLRTVMLPYWEDYPRVSIWRPAAKLLWNAAYRSFGFNPTVLSIFTAALAAVCAAAFVAAISPPVDRRLAVAAALAALLHPYAADVLLPFVGQADLIALAATLLAWNALRKTSILAFAASALLMCLAFFSKEVSYPAVLALPAAIFLGEGSFRSRRSRAFSALLVCSTCLAVRFALQLSLFPSANPLSGSSAGPSLVIPGERSLSIMEAAGRYARLVVLPYIPQTDYSFLKQPQSSAGIYPFLGAAAAIIPVGLLILMLRRTPASRAGAPVLRMRRQAAAALIWTIVFFLPYAGPIPYPYWAARFCLFGMFGLTWFIAAAVQQMKHPARRIPIAWLYGVILIGALLITNRAKDWRAPINLWAAELLREPTHAVAWKNYAVYLEHSGRAAQAQRPAKRATELWPNFGELWLALGQIASINGDLKTAADALTRAEKLLPESAEVQLGLGLLAAQQRNLKAAESRFLRILEKDPGNRRARELLTGLTQDPGK